MTAKASFTPEEWDLILEGPPFAGLVVSTAERGGTFREAFSIAKAYGERASAPGRASCSMRSSPRSPRSIAAATAPSRS